MLNLSKILNFIFIEECLGCQRIGQIICKECVYEIKNEKIENKLKSIEWIKISLSYKNKILKKAIFQLKYYYVKSIGKYLADLVYKDFLNFINEILEKQNTNIQNIIIVPIPISKKRLIERNYNQSEVLVKEIIKFIKEKENLNLENNLYLKLLIKIKNTIKFAYTHSSTEREELIKDAFEINKDYQKDFFENKTIILFDDITTTGSTFYEARKTLIDFGVKKENIFGFALAH